MRVRACLAAAGGALVLLTAQAAAAAKPVVLTFAVDVTASSDFPTGGDGSPRDPNAPPPPANPFTPFSLQLTWTLSPDGFATVSDVPLTTAMKALESPATSYVGTFAEMFGETRVPTKVVQLSEIAVGGSHAFNLSLTKRNLDLHFTLPAFGPDLIAFVAGAGPFAFDLVGPAAGGGGGVGEQRDPNQPPDTTHPVEYSGVATLVPAPAQVPEPAAWMLMIVGFGAAGAALRTNLRARGGLNALPQPLVA